MSPAVTLRAATLDDEDALLRWRNDPAVRAASVTQHEVAPDEHAAWLRRVLADPAVDLCVVLVDGEPAGQVRLDRDGPAAEVSIALDPARRGAGTGRRALELAAELAAAGGARELVARVRPDNEASLRAFAAAGFAEAGERDGLRLLARRLDQLLQ